MLALFLHPVFGYRTAPVYALSVAFETKCGRFFSEHAWSSWTGLRFFVLATLSNRCGRRRGSPCGHGSIGDFFGRCHLQVLHPVVSCVASPCSSNASLVFRVAQSRRCFFAALRVLTLGVCFCSGVVSGHIKRGANSSPKRTRV